MKGFRRLFFASVAAFCLWRGDRHISLAQRWRTRAFRFDRKSKG